MGLVLQFLFYNAFLFFWVLGLRLRNDVHTGLMFLYF